MIQSNTYLETLKFTVAEGWRMERGSGSTNPKVCLLHQSQDPSDWKRFVLLLLFNWFVKSNTQPDMNKTTDTETRTGWSGDGGKRGSNLPKEKAEKGLDFTFSRFLNYS